MDQQITSEKILLDNIKSKHLTLIDWQNEKLNFIPLRGSWFSNSETDFDLEAEIDKFMSPKNNKKIMLLMGDSGAGKSLYTQGLVNNLWQNFSAQSPIPVWISLPSLKDPVNKAIEETFEKYGFNKEQIEELRKTRAFIFILDAYDEIRCEKNLYQTNNLDKWNAKIIFTCRREYLYHKDNYKLFFAPFIDDKIQYTQYEEIYIRPFNANQIQTYIQQYIKTQKPNWDSSEKYQKAIEEITGLKELIKTPFMLKLTMEVLPQIVEKYATANLMEKSKITQAALYDVFIEQWFIRQEKKLKEAKQIKADENIKQEFWAYAKELATEMHKSNLTQVVYNANEESDLFSTEVKENPWVKFFSSKYPRIELLKTACLVRETSQHHYTFIHSSLLEYFLTRNLYEHITTKNTELTANLALIMPAQAKQTIVAAASSTTETNKYNNLSSQISKSDYFNERLIVKEENTLQFLADRVNEQETFKQSLFDRVYASRNNPSKKVAAANAITILNRARVVFSVLDMSHIQIPDADLSEALMHYTNLSHSDLQRVTFRDAYLSNANLSNTLLNEVILGQLPMLTFEYAVSSICYSNDGHYLAVISNSKLIMWDLNTMQKSDHVFKHGKDGDSDSISCVTFSPDGKTIAIGSSTSEWTGYSYQNHPYVIIWDITAQRQVGKTLQRTLQGGDSISATMLAFSPDGNLLATAGFNKENGIQIWDVHTQQFVSCPQKGAYEGERKKIINNIGIFSPNGKWLAATSVDYTIQLLDVVTLQVVGKPFKGHTNIIHCLTFSPNSKLLVSGGLDSIRIWEVESQVQLGAPLISGSGFKEVSISFHPEGKMLAGSVGGAPILWDMTTQQSIGKPFKGHIDKVNCIAFSPDGKSLASGSSDKTIRRWDITFKPSIDKFRNDVSTSIASLCFINNNYLMGDCRDSAICFWSTKSKQLTNKIINVPESSFKRIAYSLDGKILVKDSNNTLHLCDVSSQQIVSKPLSEYKEDISSAAFSSNIKIIASYCKKNKQISLWDVASNKQIVNPFNVKLDSVWVDSMGAEHPYEIGTYAISPDGKWLASGCSDNHIRIWDTTTQQLVGKPIRGHQSFITTIAFSSNSIWLASGSDDNTVRIWEVGTWRPVGIRLDVTTKVLCVAFSPDSDWLAISSEGRTIRIWSTNKQKFLYIYAINSITNAYNICFSPDGQQLAIASGNCIGLFQYQPIARNQSAFCLIWYTGDIVLVTDDVLLDSVVGLSENNSKLLIQNAAFKDPYDRPDTNAAPNFNENNAKQGTLNKLQKSEDKTQTAIANTEISSISAHDQQKQIRDVSVSHVSTALKSSPVFGGSAKPAAAIISDKSKDNIQENKNSEKEKCLVM